VKEIWKKKKKKKKKKCSYGVHTMNAEAFMVWIPIATVIVAIWKGRTGPKSLVQSITNNCLLCLPKCIGALG